jgi:acyl-coenzyme A thioesterase PaaI-like protein
MDIKRLLEGAYSSSWGLKKLNFIFSKGIPFNAPHGIKIAELQPGHCKTIVPYKRRNFNHLKGIHACCLATLAEFTSGVAMLSKLDGAKYRLIMESIEVKYHYQAKMACSATYGLNDQECASKITEPLKNGGVVYYKCEVPIHDSEGNLICTGYINWQIKDWQQVKTVV